MNDELLYDVDLRQSDHSQFTAIFNESEVINFTDTSSDIIGTSSDDYLKSSNDYANETFRPNIGFDYVDGGYGELDTLIFNGSFDDYFISKDNTTAHGDTFDLRFSNLFETNFYDKQLKSFCATVTLFQYCFSNNVKSIGVIGQDGYIFNPDQNHYDSRYKYESSDFEKSNKRIIKVHDVVQKHAKKNNVKIYYLTKNSIIKTHPYLEFEDFLNL